MIAAGTISPFLSLVCPDMPCHALPYPMLPLSTRGLPWWSYHHVAPTCRASQRARDRPSCGGTTAARA